jgi:hypothetical protein
MTGGTLPGNSVLTYNTDPSPPTHTTKSTCASCSTTPTTTTTTTTDHQAACNHEHGVLQACLMTYAYPKSLLVARTRSVAARQTPSSHEPATICKVRVTNNNPSNTTVWSNIRTTLHHTLTRIGVKVLAKNHSATGRLFPGQFDSMVRGGWRSDTESTSVVTTQSSGFTLTATAGYTSLWHQSNANRKSDTSKEVMTNLNNNNNNNKMMKLEISVCNIYLLRGCVQCLTVLLPPLLRRLRLSISKARRPLPEMLLS